METVYHTAVFSGMNEVVSADLLDEKTAVLLVNAEIRNGKISSIHKKKLTSFSSWSAMGCYGNQNRSVVKWYGRSYWSVNQAGSHPYGGNIENFLGISYPSSAPAVTLASPTGSLTGITGKYKYCITYVTENGWESAPGAEGSVYYTSVSPSSQVCVITAPSTFPANVYKVKVYRTSDEGADFFHVGTISEAGGTFTDSTPDDTLLLLNTMDSMDNYPPPSGGMYLSEYGGVFYLAVGSRLYFSVQGNPHAWPTLNFLGFDDDITGICPEFQGILVFTRNRTYRVTGDSTETMVKSLLPSQQGCVSFRTISHISNAPIWLSNDGLCIWDGENLSIVSHNIMNLEQKDLFSVHENVLWAESANDRYYLFLGNTDSTRTIVFDRRDGDVFSENDTAYTFAWYKSNSDKFYVEENSQIYEYDSSDELEEYTWVSPAIGGDSLVMKQFSEMYAELGSTDGKIPYADIYLYIDGFDPLLDTGYLMHVKVTGEGRHRIKFPYPTESRKIQIKIKGKGSLNELLVSSR